MEKARPQTLLSVGEFPIAEDWKAKAAPLMTKPMRARVMGMKKAIDKMALTSGKAV